MPIDFPNSPSNGSTHTVSGVTWEYDGTAWNVASGGAGLRVSATAPTSPATGDLWYDSESGKVFIYYDSQWVSPAVVASVPTASAGTITGSNSEGTASTFARSDHNHQIKAVGAFHAYRNTNQTGLSNAVSTQVHFDEELFDISGWFAKTGTTGNNGTQGRFTPQLAGIYRFSAFLTTSVSGNTYLDFCKNNATFYEVGAESAIQRVFGTCLIEMNGSTDYVDLRIYNGTGSSLTVNAGSYKSYFCGEYVGAA